MICQQCTVHATLQPFDFTLQSLIYIYQALIPHPRVGPQPNKKSPPASAAVFLARHRLPRWRPTWAIRRPRGFQVLLRGEVPICSPTPNAKVRPVPTTAVAKVQTRNRFEPAARGDFESQRTKDAGLRKKTTEGDVARFTEHQSRRMVCCPVCIFKLELCAVLWVDGASMLDSAPAPRAAHRGRPRGPSSTTVRRSKGRWIVGAVLVGPKPISSIGNECSKMWSPLDSHSSPHTLSIGDVRWAAAVQYVGQCRREMGRTNNGFRPPTLPFAAAAAPLPATAAPACPSPSPPPSPAHTTCPARSPATPARAATSSPVTAILQEKTPSPVQIEETGSKIPISELDLSPELLDWGSIEDEDGAYADRGGLQLVSPPRETTAPDRLPSASPLDRSGEGRAETASEEVRTYATVARLNSISATCASGSPAPSASRKPEEPAKLKSAIGVDLTRKTGVFTRLSAPIAAVEKKLSPIWVEVKYKHRKSKADIPLQVASFKSRDGRPHAGDTPGDKLPAYKEAFVGRCFRCLASDHRLSQCRDPPRCLACRRSGHFARDCPERRRRSLHSRLSFPPRKPVHFRLTFPPPNIHNRLSFPPLSSTPVLPPVRHQHSPADPMEYIPGLPDQRPERSATMVVASDSITRESNRLFSHAVLITIEQGGYRSSVIEVVYGLSQQLRLPRYNIKVSRHRPEDFLADFDFTPQCDRAVAAGQIVIGGTTLSIVPWRPTSKGPPRTWWFNAKVSIESMPLELWSVKGVSKVLGDDCIIDRLDSRTYNKEVTHTFSCWVWMSNPDHLPRSRGCLLFPKGAGRAVDVEDLHTLRRCPGTPPVGRPSFKWTPGVLDGQGPTTPGLNSGCRGLVPHRRRDQDPDDDRHGRLCTAQLLPKVTPPLVAFPYSWPASAPLARSPVRVWRPRDPQRCDAVDWERRRSRSPSLRSPVSSPGATSKLANSYYEVAGLDCTAPCFGNLDMHAPAAPDAPSPPKQHPDPLLDYFKVLCAEPFPANTYRGSMVDDPMVLEASLPPRISNLLSFSTKGTHGQVVAPASYGWDTEDAMAQPDFSPTFSPVYQPTSGPWATNTDNVEQQSAPVPAAATMDDITAQVTRMDIDSEQQPSFTEQVFSELPPAILESPARHHRQPPACMEESADTSKGLRASSRLAARPSSIPVSKRAQHRLIRELDFINKDERIVEDVVSAYIETYKTPLPSAAVSALRVASRLGNKAASSALASLVEEEGAIVELEGA
ncbi:hypothetical protein HU200_064773 [Digitaria exilis]|uniref:CCHC-type domain-containing protein n=1 Tax=Digitaria exilis TaxID=1010633 RepID=A0A835DYJ7_9POAL|nr:hypothetical protein HU200_064773 [Digitaria exilis]